MLILMILMILIKTKTIITMNIMKTIVMEINTM